MADINYLPHHTAISVRDLDKTLEFYGVFGFREVHRYEDEDRTGVKLRLDGYVIEVFAYKDNGNKPVLDSEIGNNLSEIGIKHIAFTTADIEMSLKDLKAKRLANDEVQILSKDTARFFFIKDPDGMWVEIIKDDRY